MTLAVPNRYNHTQNYSGGVCMKGGIYTDEPCPRCGGRLRHDENLDGFVCCNEPNHPMIIPRKMRVKFGTTYGRFSEYKPARQFLDGLRYKSVEGTYDARDYKKDAPLGFENQAIRYLAIKKRNVSGNQYRDIERTIFRAIKVWHSKNVKTIGYSDIEDFLYNLGDVSDKTRANARSALHAFWTWLVDREQVSMPKFPKIDFDLGWRNIVSIDDQQAILEEARQISWDINPKIWIGIHWLCTYVAIRPNELRHLKERHIDVDGFFVLPPDNTKEKQPKLVAMLPDDIELYRSIKPRGFPDLYFFRHEKGNGAAKPGSQFGKDYWYKWWKIACKNLGIEGVDLYGGTRHSTATAMSEYFSEQEIMDAATMHKSNKAARRYIQAKKNKSLQVYQQIRDIQRPGDVVKVGFGEK